MAAPTQADVRRALRTRFKGHAWAVLEEVPDSTGALAKRSADMVVMSVWPSRGLDIHGIEIKVARSDFLRELKAPEKAEPVQSYCDRWWIAAGSKDIVRPGELPPTWGLLVLRGKHMVCQVEAPRLEPKALDKYFLASLLRRASDSEEGIRKASWNDGYAAGKQTGPDALRADITRLTNELEEHQRMLAAFEEASGLKLQHWDHWGAREIGEIVARVRKVRAKRFRGLDRDDVLALARGQIAALERAASVIRESLESEEDEQRIVEGALTAHTGAEP